MTQDEIYEMAHQAGVKNEFNYDFRLSIEAFAKLVAAKAFQDGYEKGVAVFNEAVWIEREACAKVCDEYSATGKIEEFDRGWLACAKNVAAAIRARGKA
jgi:hypothetical protein